MHAFLMVAEDFDHAALVDAAMGGAFQHALQFRFQ